MKFVLNTEAANFACARQELALSIHQLAHYLSVNVQTIMEWECGGQTVPAHVWSAFDQLKRQSVQTFASAASAATS